jgi:hypothetical protein
VGDKAKTGSIIGASGAFNGSSPILDENDDAIPNQTPTAPKVQLMPFPSVLSGPPAAPKEVLAAEKPTLHRAPGLELVTRLVIVADILVGIRLIETYRSYVDAAAIPRRLRDIFFELAEYTLHPPLTWDDVAAGIMAEQVRP